MTELEVNARALQRKLRLAGFTPVYEPIDLADLEFEDRVEYCEAISKKHYYKIIYLEARSNWRKLTKDIVRSQLNLCLVIAKYDESRIVMATKKDYGTKEEKIRYLVIDTGKDSKNLDKFIKSIKTDPTDNFLKIDERVQRSFDDLTAYNQAIDEFAESLDEIIQKTRLLVDDRISGNRKYSSEALKFLKSCQSIINENMTLDDIRDMVIQHILTSKIFSLIYDEAAFNTTNTVARSLEKLKRLLKIKGDHINYQTLELIAESLTDDDSRQEFLKKVYETFYGMYDPKLAEREGIVYTPKEIVSFIVKSVDHLLREHFGKGLGGESVIILDPFTGTGTFPVEVMRKIGPDDLERKYSDIHASEISVLAYYIAALNIEHTYREIVGKYREFDNICWMDTFEKGTKGREKMGKFLEIDKNMERVTRQQQLDIRVIVGNPPYSRGQSNYNDQNQNISYPEIDQRIKDTYLQRFKDINPKGGNVNSVYDSYIRSIRWTSDRIGKSGIIGFVTNAGFLRSDTGAGIRACLTEEFTDVWCFDLRGNQRTQGEISKKEGGKVFGSGSRAPVAITILVKNPAKKKHTIRYHDIGDYHSREKKLEIIRELKSINGISDWQIITPDRHHDWLDQRREEFYKYLQIGSKSAKIGKENTIFIAFSRGVGTGRDSWAYNTSKKKVSENMRRHVEYCNSQDPSNPKMNSKMAKWDSHLTKKLLKKKQDFNQNKIRTALYRPFFKQYLYFDSTYNQEQPGPPPFFPQNDSENLVICVPDKGMTGKFSVLITDITPDLHIIEQSQCFPFYVYKDGTKHDNITDRTLSEYRNHYNDSMITKRDIFYYVYGLLHHPEYRKKFANNLSRELPHIPMAPDFWAFSKIGKQLADLHLSWETCKRYNLGKPKNKFGKYAKMSFAKKMQNGKRVTDYTTLRINDGVAFENVPEVKYRINGRTPLEWAIDRYKLTKNKDSGITNDSTNVDIISLVERLVYVGIESDRLISLLPEEFEPKDWEPTKSGMDKYVETVYQSKMS